MENNKENRYIKNTKKKKKEYMKKYKKNQSNNALKKTKENNGLRSFEKDVVTNFNKDMMESSSNAEVYIDNDDFEEDKVIRFRQNTCD